MAEKPGEIYYIFVAEIRKEVGYIKARRLVKELTGKTYFLTGLQTMDAYRFKINNKCWFDLTTLKRKIVDDDLTLIIGKLKRDGKDFPSIKVIQDDTAIVEDRVWLIPPALD